MTYSYYLSPDFHVKTTSNPSLPILMLVHGFPNNAHMWDGAVRHLQSLGYVMLLPDLLGFAGSSKSTDPRHYNYRQQANSLAQVLDAEGVTDKRAIPIGA